MQETGKGESQLEYWNEKVLSLGEGIQNKRENLIDFFNENLNSKLEQSKSNLRAKAVYDVNRMSKERLEDYRLKEIGAGTSLIGPHRDDFRLAENGFDLSSYASRGQQRTLILALKLCELEYLEKVTERKPILLLDDIFSELDERHRSTVKCLVSGHQTILTSTEITKDFEDFPKNKLT
jgi:DNA replication and repair protein RecF